MLDNILRPNNSLEKRKDYHNVWQCKLWLLPTYIFAILVSYEPKKNIEQENQLLQIKSKSSVNSKSKDFGSEF